MINSWFFNLYTAIFGFFLAFIVSVGTNTITTSLIRGLLSFLIFFFLGFGLRWVISFVLTDTITRNPTVTTNEKKDNIGNDNPDLVNNQNNSNSENNSSQSTVPFSSLDDNGESGETIEGDLYERTSEFIRDLLVEDDRK